MMSILLNRLFHLDLSRHVLKDEIFTFKIYHNKKTSYVIDFLIWAY